jgi:hypothetical protein
MGKVAPAESRMGKVAPAESRMGKGSLVARDTLRDFKRWTGDEGGPPGGGI